MHPRRSKEIPKTFLGLPEFPVATDDTLVARSTRGGSRRASPVLPSSAYDPIECSRQTAHHRGVLRTDRCQLDGDLPEDSRPVPSRSQGEPPGPSP